MPVNRPVMATVYNRVIQFVVDAINHQFASCNRPHAGRLIIGSAMKRWAIIGALLCALMVPSQLASADAADTPGDSHERESLIKAAFLYNFAKFTDWPEDAFAGDIAELSMCVLGDDPFGETLNSIEGKSIQGRPLRTLHLDSPEQVAQCHLLFIAASEQEQLAHVLEAVGSAPVLTVAELPDFAQAGGIIKLKTVDNKVRFEINVEVATRVGLHLSPRLLRLAEAATSQETRKSVDAQLR